MVPFRLLLGAGRAVLRLIDRFVEPPVMREHVNGGSYRYFDSEHEHRDRGGIADVLGDRPPNTD
jgi:hypothetical protein